LRRAIPAAVSWRIRIRAGDPRTDFLDSIQVLDHEAAIDVLQACYPALHAEPSQPDSVLPAPAHGLSGIPDPSIRN
jgi:hypothetical protein